MSATNAFETALLALIFNATTLGDYAENDSSSPLANFQLSLHTGDPGETGDQTTNEAAYTSYAREAVARTSGGWTVSGNQATLTSLLGFTQASGGSETETHFGIGRAASSTGTLDFSGTVSPNIVVSSGVTPQLTTSTAVSLD